MQIQSVVITRKISAGQRCSALCFLVAIIPASQFWAPAVCLGDANLSVYSTTYIRYLCVTTSPLMLLLVFFFFFFPIGKKPLMWRSDFMCKWRCLGQGCLVGLREAMSHRALEECVCGGPCLEELRAVHPGRRAGTMLPCSATGLTCPACWERKCYHGWVNRLWKKFPSSGS